MKKILLAVMLLTTVGFSVETPEEEFDKQVLEGYMKACDVGDVGSCDKAVKYSGEACDSGDMYACTKLGLIYADGMYVKIDYFKSVKYYTKACDGGYAKACYCLAFKYLSGVGCKQSNSKAKELFGKACDGKYELGCKDYEDMTIKGH